MEKTNNIVVMHYDKDRPEAYAWFHRDEWIRYKDFCDEQDRRFARWFFIGKDTPEPAYLEEWNRLSRERILSISGVYRRFLLS